jgi:putative FmdB family regulatory protein
VPIYEYRCPNGHTFEIFQRMADPPVVVCETCGAGPVEKLLFPIAVHFKGKGFYSTDYGRSSGGGAAKETDSTPSEKGEKGTAAADASSGGEKKASGGDGGTSTSSRSD